MYGMVNMALEWMVTEENGADSWNAIRQAAGLDAGGFVSMHAYPDAVTYDLVGHASTVLDEPAGDLLRRFGRAWVRFVSQQGYETLLAMAGQDVAEILENLNDLHTRVGLNFPELSPPSFRVTDREGTRLALHYVTERPGLDTFVVGLVEGLGEFKGEPVEIRRDDSRSDVEGHSVFDVVVGTAATP